MCDLVVFVLCFFFVASPSVLWYCWLGLLTCKNRLPYKLYCVGEDVKHCTIQSKARSLGLCSWDHLSDRWSWRHVSAPWWLKSKFFIRPLPLGTVTRLVHLVWETLNRYCIHVCLVCPDCCFSPTDSSSGCECNLIADVTWPVSIGLQLQEPTNTARPSLENDTCASHVFPTPHSRGPHSPAANDCRWWTTAYSNSSE